MKLNALEGKKVIIAPYSPLSITFATFLKERQIDVIGFMDSNKVASGVYRPYELGTLDFDRILIYNALYFDEIYRESKKYTAPNSIFRVLSEEGRYSLQNRQEIMLNRFKGSIEALKRRAYIVVLKVIVDIYDLFSIKRENVVFIAKDSIGSNLKHLYLHLLAEHPKRVTMITGNPSEIDELIEHDLEYARYGSFKSHIAIAKAKTIIMEQIIHDYLEPISARQRTIQLWHGIALKRLYKSTTTTYDLVLSTSSLTTEVIFKQIFQAKEIVPYGYPRNDVLFREPTETDLMFCDKEVYALVKRNFEHGIKSIIYMPTYRENAEANIPPLDLDLLNETMREAGSYFIIKLHPFALELFNTSIESTYSNIIFHDTQGDVYPILKYVDILVTDYSSVAYDFLMLDRPMIFFDHDHEEYTRSRGEFFFDFDAFTPGPKVKTQEELTEALLQALTGLDTLQEQRLALREQLFDHIDGDAAKRIAQRI